MPCFTLGPCGRRTGWRRGSLVNFGEASGGRDVRCEVESLAAQTGARLQAAGEIACTGEAAVARTIPSAPQRQPGSWKGRADPCSGGRSIPRSGASQEFSRWASRDKSEPVAALEDRDVAAPRVLLTRLIWIALF